MNSSARNGGICLQSTPVDTEQLHYLHTHNPKGKEPLNQTITQPKPVNESSTHFQFGHGQIGQQYIIRTNIRRKKTK